jgi:hypothetical protein
VIYAVLVYYHRDFVPVLNLVGINFSEAETKFLKSDTYVALVVFAVMGFAALLKLDHRFNPMIILRDTLQTWVSIPQRVQRLNVLAQQTLVVPMSYLDNLPAKYDLKKSDFAMDKVATERLWAETCYIHDWLVRRRSSLFFEEPRLKWQDVSQRFDEAVEEVSIIRGHKAERAMKPAGREKVRKTVCELHEAMCLLAACLISYNNFSESDLTNDARDFGVMLSEQTVANPLRYIIIYIVALGMSLYFGVLTFASFYELLVYLFGIPATQAPVQSSVHVAYKYVAYGLFSWGVPIGLVFLMKYLEWRNRGAGSAFYLAKYCWIGVLCFVVGAVSLTAAEVIMGTGVIKSLSLADKFFNSLQWVVPPAVICVYIVYFLDKRIDPGLPDVNFGPKTRVRRTLRCLALAALLMLGEAVPVENLPESTSGWSTPKRQTVILGVTFVTCLTMGFLAEFLPVLGRPGAWATSGRSGSPTSPNGDYD